MGGQPPYQPPPGYQPYGGGGAREHPQGTTILVFGILSLVVCSILGPFAWSMGNKALREMDSTPGIVWTNRGNVTAGRICGIVSSVLMIVGLGFLLLVLAVSLGNA